MREILFRGKRVDNGEWVYGVFIPDCLESLHGQDCHWGFIKTYRLEGKYENVKNETVEVDRETVGQYTGKTDKNGKKIFEGDIVEFTDKYTGGKGRAEIVFEAFKWKYSGCYYGGNPIVWLCIDDLSIKFEVIGNIYDNPELLEGKK